MENEYENEFDAINENELVRASVKLNCPLVDVEYDDGNKRIKKTMRDVTDYFNHSEEIKAMSIKVGR